MYKYILELAGNINWMALFALLTFLFVFVVSAVLAFTKSSEQTKYMAELPLQNEVNEDVNL